MTLTFQTCSSTSVSSRVRLTSPCLTVTSFWARLGNLKVLMPAGIVTSALTSSEAIFLASRSGASRLRLISADGFSGRITTSSDSAATCGLTLFLAVVDDLHFLGLELQEHGAEPGLPGRLEPNVGQRGAGLEITRQAQLLQLDAKRPAVQDQRFRLGSRHAGCRGRRWRRP